MRRTRLAIAALALSATLAGCSADTWRRTGFNALSARACRHDGPPRADCTRSYDAEYVRYRDALAKRDPP